jgi:hypothetical protein
VTDAQERQHQTDRSDRHDDGDRGREAGSLPAGAIRIGVRQLTEFTGRQPEAISSVEPDDGGWRLTVEVVELERIPASTNVMATYEAVVDDEGNLLRFQRLHRYHRNQADEGDR